jgi:hypothetical protein
MKTTHPTPIQSETLTRLLAQADAIFKPLRRWEYPLPAVIHELRRDYKTHGLPWRNWGNGEAEEKAILRALGDMEAEGLVETFAGGLKLAGARLTDRGDYFARALCGLAGFDDAQSALAELMAAIADGKSRTIRGERWVSETILAGADYDGTLAPNNLFLAVEWLLLPCIVRGLVVSNADAHGRVAYALGDHDAPFDDPGAMPKRLPNGFQRYLAARRDAWATLGGRTPQEPREIGGCPLPVSD